MARLVRTQGAVPIDLQKFDSKRWIREALNDDDSHLRLIASRHTRSEVLKHWYAILIVAPAHYRAALWKAVGERDGDRYFEEEMSSAKVTRQRRLTIQSMQKET